MCAVGMYIPSCDEDGYYRKLQCDQSRAECWCVDPHGSEVSGSRVHGNPDCGECQLQHGIRFVYFFIDLFIYLFVDTRNCIEKWVFVYSKNYCNDI